MQKNNIELRVFPIGELGANMAIIHNLETKEAVLIDPGNEYNQINSILTEMNLKVIKLIHTHGHFDHIGQTPEVKKNWGGEILLHKADDDLYSNMAESASRFFMSTAKYTPVDTYIEEGNDINIFDNFNLKVLHTPGHSLGSCCFYTDFFDTPLLLSGDTLFQQSIGRTDLPGGDYNQLITSIKTKLLPLPDNTICICGHGPKTTIESEKANNPFLK